MSAISVIVDIATQELRVLGLSEPRVYTVSTALKGAGEQQGSERTPRGQHVISEKFGDNQPVNSVFVGRVATGEVYSPELAAQHPQRDWILSRILWLDGTQPGFNRGEGCDSHSRYIYIHGTPDSEPMGVAQSHGCIRMRNSDIMELYPLLEVGTPVDIYEAFPQVVLPSPKVAGATL